MPLSAENIRPNDPSQAQREREESAARGQRLSAERDILSRMQQHYNAIEYGDKSIDDVPSGKERRLYRIYSQIKDEESKNKPDEGKLGSLRREFRELSQEEVEEKAREYLKREGENRRALERARGEYIRARVLRRSEGTVRRLRRSYIAAESRYIKFLARKYTGSLTAGSEAGNEGLNAREISEKVSAFIAQIKAQEWDALSEQEGKIRSERLGMIRGWRAFKRFWNRPGVRKIRTIVSLGLLGASIIGMAAGFPPAGAFATATGSWYMFGRFMTGAAATEAFWDKMAKRFNGLRDFSPEEIEAMTPEQIKRQLAGRQVSRHVTAHQYPDKEATSQENERTLEHRMYGNILANLVEDSITQSIEAGERNSEEIIARALGAKLDGKNFLEHQSELYEQIERKEGRTRYTEALKYITVATGGALIMHFFPKLARGAVKEIGAVVDWGKETFAYLPEAFSEQMHEYSASLSRLTHGKTDKIGKFLSETGKSIGEGVHNAWESFLHWWQGVFNHHLAHSAIGPGSHPSTPKQDQIVEPPGHVEPETPQPTPYGQGAPPHGPGSHPGTPKQDQIIEPPQPAPGDDTASPTSPASGGQPGGQGPPQPPTAEGATQPGEVDHSASLPESVPPHFPAMHEHYANSFSVSGGAGAVEIRPDNLNDIIKSAIKSSDWAHLAHVASAGNAEAVYQSLYEHGINAQQELGGQKIGDIALALSGKLRDPEVARGFYQLIDHARELPSHPDLLAQLQGASEPDHLTQVMRSWGSDPLEFVKNHNLTVGGHPLSFYEASAPAGEAPQGAQQAQGADSPAQTPAQPQAGVNNSESSQAPGGTETPASPTPHNTTETTPGEQAGSGGSSGSPEQVEVSQGTPYNEPLYRQRVVQIFDGIPSKQSQEIQDEIRQFLNAGPNADVADFAYNMRLVGDANSPAGASLVVTRENLGQLTIHLPREGRTDGTDWLADILNGKTLPQENLAGTPVEVVDKTTPVLSHILSDRIIRVGEHSQELIDWLTKSGQEDFAAKLSEIMSRISKRAGGGAINIMLQSEESLPSGLKLQIYDNLMRNPTSIALPAGKYLPDFLKFLGRLDWATTG